jgi:hypothetical protein
MTVMWETNQKLPSRVEFGVTPKLDRAVEANAPVSLHEVTLYGLDPGTTYHYRVRSGDLVSAPHTFKTAPPAGTKRWRMALYGDSRSNPAVHRKIAEQIAKAHVDLIVHTGDIVLNGKKHETWRTEFFEPLSGLAHSTPWVSTIGNHERDSEHYFSYMALPGNERYFGFDYANAHFVCLDSNDWIEKGRDSQQLQWLQAHLRRKRNFDWTFAAFHHSLFSAHGTRPIIALRWDWAPVFLDPANHVDGVLTGHDHFYSRNYPMGRVSQEPQQGVLFLTSAGGGASLYRTKKRDYVAKVVEAFHFTLFEFDGDKVSLTAIDPDGKVIDQFVLAKRPMPPEDFCAYEVEELRQSLRLTLGAAPTIPFAASETYSIDTRLEVPAHFQVPLRGRLVAEEADGWTWIHPVIPFQLEPGKPLRIPLQANVKSGHFRHTPAMTIEFEPGHFRNRQITFYPLKLAGPREVEAQRTTQQTTIDGRLSKPNWIELKKKSPATSVYSLIGLPPQGGWADRVMFLADDHWLYVGGSFGDHDEPIRVLPEGPTKDAGRLVLQGEHVRVVLSDGKTMRTFALSPDQARYLGGNAKDERPIQWQARAGRDKDGWSAEFSIPRLAFEDLGKVRVNVVRRAKIGRGYNDFEMCPTYGLGEDSDLIPDWKPVERVDRFAALVVR